jgi:hypothetical protein
MPLDTSGGKTTRRAWAAPIHMASGYALCAALNIITVGEDDDAQGGPITVEQAKEIRDGLIETGLDDIKFLKTLKAGTVDEIRSKDLQRARTALDAKRYQMLQQQKAGKNANPA